MHWQGKSVQFDELAFVPAQTTFISRQRDRTLRRGRYAPYTCERNLNALAHFTHWLPMCHLSAVIILKKAVQTCPASSFGGSHGGNGRVILATT